MFWNFGLGLAMWSLVLLAAVAALCTVAAATGSVGWVLSPAEYARRCARRRGAALRKKSYSTAPPCQATSTTIGAFE
ncbi:unnamed protein product, partial [Polarella glacialis]